MGPLRRYVRLALPLGLLAAVAAVVRSRREVEVWHMAVADTPDPGNGQGP
ncbi:hypothetical protein [Mycobacterium sp. HUMS_1102779]